MKSILIMAVVLLSGCATPPRWLANMYDANDHCQNFYNRPDYVQPNYCGGGSSKTYTTRDWRTGNYQSTTTVR